MTSPGLDNPQLSPLVAAELRAEMARQQKTLPELAEALGLRDPASARVRYDGTKSLTLREVEHAAEWLRISVRRLLDVDMEVAS